MKTTLRFSFGLFVACGLVLGGCERKVDKPSTTPPVAIMPPDSAWVYQNKAQRADVAIVFVHGIFGDARDTWTNANGQTFFDLIHDHPNVGKPVDVFTFGFPSGVFDKGAFDVQDASKSLRDKLLFYGVDKYESVVFVAHSMGGLVVMRTLITYPELRRQTPLVALYGTPQEGAQVSTIATRLTGNPALKQMLPADTDGFLRVLDTDWKLQDPALRPKVACAFEKSATYGYLIVPWAGATRFCDGPGTPIGENHMGIVKPDGREHDAVIMLVNALNATVTGAEVGANLSTPDFSQVGSDYIFSLASPVGTHPARLINAGKKRATFTLAEVSNGLYVWPNDTPKSIEGGERINLFFGLGWGQLSQQYHFTLRSDAGAEKKVIVKVADVTALQLERERLERVAFENLNALLRGPKVRSDWGSTADKQKANQDLVDNIRKTVRQANPRLPLAAQWALAGELAYAIKLPDLTLLALQHSRKISPQGASMPAFTKLAALAREGARLPFAADPGESMLAAVGERSQLWQAPTSPGAQTAALLRDYPGLSGMGAKPGNDIATIQDRDFSGGRIDPEPADERDAALADMKRSSAARRDEGTTETRRMSIEPHRSAVPARSGGKGF